MKIPSKSKLNRKPSRGSYDWESIYQILKSSYLGHVGIAAPYPVVIPTLYGVRDKSIYLHGASVSRLMKSLESEIDLCFTVTQMDGIVLARSGFNHSMNYHSVMLFGKGILVEGKEKLEGLKVLSDQCIPGRWEELRKPHEKEIKATTVVKLIIEEGSAKVREGHPIDDEEDYQLDVWAGVIPIKQVYGTPIPDDRLKPHVPFDKSIEKIISKNTTG